jgi:hypothetical protein
MNELVNGIFNIVVCTDYTKYSVFNEYTKYSVFIVFKEYRVGACTKALHTPHMSHKYWWLSGFR